jgi:multiple sugar transport system substrate-binding protein
MDRLPGDDGGKSPLSFAAAARRTARRAFVRVLVAAVLLGSGCGAPAAEPAKLRFWVMGREGEVVQQLLPEFERRNPDVRVQIQQLPWTVAHEKLLTAFAGGSLPDLCQLGNTWIAEFSTLNALSRLDERVASSRSIDPRDYFGGIWDTNVVGGAVAGIPWYVDTRLLFYRKDLLRNAGFDSAPRSWDEWQRALAAIKRQAGPQRYSILLPLNEVEPLLALALQQGKPFLRDDDGRGAFAEKGFRQALDFYAAMFRNGWAPLVGGAQISNVWNEFGRGYFAFYISGPWNIEEFKRRLPANVSDQWMTAPLPGPDGPGASTAGGSSLVIFRSSRHVDAAWRLIEYLSQPEIQLRFHALTGNLPPRRSAWDDKALANDVYARAFRDQLERVQPLPRIAEWERVATAVQLTAEEVARGRSTVDAAVRALDERVDAILAKRRWMLARGLLR